MDTTYGIAGEHPEEVEECGSLQEAAERAAETGWDVVELDGTGPYLADDGEIIAPTHAPKRFLDAQEVTELLARGRCECGEVLGESCRWEGPEAEMVTVEYMPEYLRASHIAAGNRGVWPHNGSLRLRCSPECATLICEGEGDWAVIIGWASADGIGSEANKAPKGARRYHD
jgi:hypothetical protein